MKLGDVAGKWKTSVSKLLQEQKKQWRKPVLMVNAVKKWKSFRKLLDPVIAKTKKVQTISDEVIIFNF